MQAHLKITGPLIFIVWILSTFWDFHQIYSTLLNDPIMDTRCSCRRFVFSKQLLIFLSTWKKCQSPGVYSMNRRGPPKKPKDEDQACHPRSSYWWWVTMMILLFFLTISFALWCQKYLINIFPQSIYFMIKSMFISHKCHNDVLFVLFLRLSLTLRGCLQNCATKAGFNSFPATGRQRPCIKSTSTK